MKSILQRRKAFTLLELLVVIAIIAILSSLVLSVLKGSNAKATSTGCLNNLKQLQICYQLYADSNSDSLVDNSTDSTEAATNAWIQGNVQMFSANYTNDVTAGILFPFNQSLTIYRCPASKAFVRDFAGHSVPHNRSYSISVWLNNNDFPGPKRSTDIRMPDQIAVFLDENAVSIDNGAIGLHCPVSDVYWNLPANRHNLGCNISFADGHVEHWRWTGPYLNQNNSEFGANDTLTERPDPEVNPTDLAPSSYNDSDAIRLANAVQTP